MTELIGRLHPLVVHLPIGFIVLLFTLEVLALSRRFKHVTSANRAIIVLTIPATAVSVLCGWLLSRSGSYDGEIIGWHKWLGVGVAGGGVILLALHRGGWVRTYRLVLLVTFTVLVITSHMGGSLTHGEDYLGSPLRKLLGREPAVPAEGGWTSGGASNPPVFVSVIQPILNHNCVPCHGQKKSKAGLRLDTGENIERGGESGDVIVPNSAALSLLIKRISLPPDHEDHMPPRGKRQPSADEITLLRWWIDAGAATDKTIAELNPPEHITRLLTARPDK